MKTKSSVYTIISLYLLTGALYVLFGALLVINGAASSKKWLLVELVLLLIPLFIATYLRGKRAKEECQKRRVIASSLWVLFSFYALTLISMLFLGSRTAFGFNARNVNLIPLASIGAYVTEWRTGQYTFTWTVMFNNLIGNLILFVPMAVLLPCLFDRMRKTWLLLSALAVMIVAVELIQLFTGTGVCDVDDFFLNFTGAACAALVFRIPPIVRILQKWHCYRADAPQSDCPQEETRAAA